MKTGYKFLTALLTTGMVVSSFPITMVNAAEKKYTVKANISYHDFYNAFGVDTLKGVSDKDTYVDAVTSATKSKYLMNTDTGMLASGTYNSEDGTNGYINGVTFPVVVDESSRDAMISAGTYKAEDFAEADTMPANYLNGAYTDGKMTYTNPELAKTTLTGVEAKLSTDTRYGDYQIDFSGADIDSNFDMASNVVYGVIVNTKENDSYGMYTLENIWRNTEIAWSTGYVTNTHGCPLRFEPYKAIMGETVTDVTYITDKGVYTLDIKDTYIPKKNGSTATAEEVKAADTTDITVKLNKLPEDYQAELSVADAADAEISKTGETKGEGTVDYTYSVKVKDLAPGTYTVQVKDTSGVYADMKATATVKGAAVTFDGTKVALDNAASGDSIANYVKNITKVDITTPAGETVSYLPKAGRGTSNIAVLFAEDGTLDTKAAYETVETSGGHGKPMTTTTVDTGNVFKEYGKYTVAVTANVYDAVTFDVTLAEEAKEPEKQDTVKEVKLSKPVVKSLSNSGKGKITVKWNKVENATGYQVKYVTGSKSKTIKVSAASKSISKLKKGKKYKVSVRAYAQTDNGTVYSAWSKAKSIKIKK